VHRAAIGMGANLGDRRGTIERAVEMLGAVDGVTVVGVSQLRETDPVGLTDQPRFLNGACLVETDLAPRPLLDVLLGIERRLGRTRDGTRWGPRAIDLDLLLYDEVVVDEPGLTLPHPRLHERRFALEPLADLDPGLVVPARGAVRDLLQDLHSDP
jgi:2-amino-4-hydroxy-6-hydroxymethyldihydropteridine diphosphokinase